MWGPQDDAVSLGALHRAIDLGVNFIDTAQGYGKGHSEELIGNLLADRREEIFVATKIPPFPGSPWPPPYDADARNFYPADYIITQCEKSLKRLRREWIDVYQFHTWSSSFNATDEWWDAMSRLRKQGKIRAVGVSVPDNTPDNVIGSLARKRVCAVQVVYNLFEQYPRLNLFPACEALGTGVIVRVPFDEGALTGKYTAITTFDESDVRRRYFRGRNLPAAVKRVDRIRQFVQERHPGMSLAEFALRFCQSHPAVGTVIPGMRSEQQVDQNCAAADGRLLDPSEVEELHQFAWRKDFWNEEVAEPSSNEGSQR